MTRVWVIIALTFAVSVVADLLLGVDVPGFAAGYGLAGCVVLIVVSKWLGRVLLQRREEYYHRGPHV